MFLSGFGTPACEAVEEIAIVDLERCAQLHAKNGNHGADASELRSTVIRFLEDAPREPYVHGYSGVDLGFEVELEWGKRVRVGALGDAPEFVQRETS